MSPASAVFFLCPAGRRQPQERRECRSRVR
nr:MAG TPA: hypothetical protein [Caudoviricetes sp.]